ncbi:keratinocyte differentiation factor 1 [Boleophthalmus pectinirostris]|uniref:keratinocyte differentiation factor 1 n=1 Tax=Boleophthalmus pectinirostris TaxID=150288 RepID=UPI00242D4DA8|nr:keratinocyte differentiation factor 1 [Boleophthalmus pectinirostris]
MSVGSAGGGVRSSGSGNSRHAFSHSISQRSSYEERCVDPVETLPYSQEPKSTHKADPRDANGNKCETIGFIPGSAEPTSVSPSCNPCTSPKRCRSVFCTVLTCGLYRFCQSSTLTPCIAPNESSPDEPEKISLRNTKTKDVEEDGKDWLNDVHIGGIRIEKSIEYPDEPRPLSSCVSSTGAVTHFSHSSLHQSMVFDDWEEEDVENVDSLITKKLLELYSEYQIEELARCTTDSVFLRKTKDINQLINSLAEEHQMDEQEAECRLVRGIIRISTRKSKKKPHISKRERTLSDSGHETMKESGSTSFSNNNDYKSSLNIQISDLTSSDKYAREMWRNNEGHSPVSPTSYSPSTTETSSGVPLIRSAVRT